MFEYTFSVRGYELDSYGHVNHAVYLNYFEQARWELFRQLDLIRYFMENELLLVVIGVQVRYIRELTLFDEAVIRTTVRKEAPYLVFNHIMYQSGTKIRICTSTIRTLFMEKGKIVRDIPGEVLSQLILS
jgi:acyl-CoA thioester hydrolase